MREQLDQARLRLVDVENQLETAIILGEKSALEFIGGWPGAAVCLVLDDGEVRYTDGFTFA